MVSFFAFDQVHELWRELNGTPHFFDRRFAVDLER